MDSDFFHVDTVFLRRYCVCFLIEVQSRVVHVLGVTTNSNGGWVTQVARNFASDLEEAGRRFRFLIRDRDTKFTRSFDEVFTSIGIETIATPVRSPRAIAYAERFVRTIRQECLDHLLVVSRGTPRVGTSPVHPAGSRAHSACTPYSRAVEPAELGHDSRWSSITPTACI